MDYQKHIIEPLKLQGILVDQKDRIIINHVIRLIAKEVFKYDEKAYVEILKKYDV